MPANNGSVNETYEWKIDNDDDDVQKLNDTDDDVDSVKKRTVLLTHIYLYVVDPLIIYSCISLTFSVVVSLCVLHGDSCRSISLADKKEQRENHPIARSVIVNGLSIKTKFSFTLSLFATRVSLVRPCTRLLVPHRVRMYLSSHWVHVPALERNPISP